jgi:hypothetical protein
MAKEQAANKEGGLEKGSRWYRNFNAAVGGVALIGAGIVASPAAAGALTAYAGFNFGQAGLGEIARRYAKNKKKRKKTKNAK